jgi:hypothetical protein
MVGQLPHSSRESSTCFSRHFILALFASANALFSMPYFSKQFSFCDFKRLACRRAWAWAERKDREVEIHMISLLSGNELRFGIRR